MAKLKPRYFVTKPGRDGPRYFWQPAKKLRAAGWTPRRLAEHAPADRALGDAINEAASLNKQLDAWRIGARIPEIAPVEEVARTDTVDALIETYRDTAFFRDLKPTTRKAYGVCLTAISRWAGDQPARAITTRQVDTLYQELRRTKPSMANLVVAVLRRLFAIGERYGFIDRGQNPAERPGTKGTGYSSMIWPRAAVDAFVETADAIGMFGMGTAITLNNWIGQNTIDVITLPRSVYRDGVLRLQRSKTGMSGSLPIDQVEEVARRLDAEFARQEAAGVAPINLIMREKTGQPYTAATFGTDFNALRAAVAADTARFAVDGDPELTVATADLKFRQLRHTSVTRLAEAGCSPAQISAITLHSLATVSQILEYYLQRTNELARGAIEKRLAKEQGDR